MKSDKIKTQAEYNESFESVVKETVQKCKCSKLQAKLRLQALLRSGLLNGKQYPYDIDTIKMIDQFMTAPYGDA